MPAILRLVASLALVLVASTVQSKDLIEFYHRELDHYFLTGDRNEITALDTGVHPGWARTGYGFQVLDAGDPRLATSIAVCRFYGNPLRGLDSHFYSATRQECDDVQRRFPEDWLLESSDFFRVIPLDGATGLCPAGAKPVYRLYNGRADVNHRYTTDVAVADAMVARGYTIEGTGSGARPAVFCAVDPSPPAPPPPSGGTPNCTLTASSTTLAVGTPLTLSVSCTNSPTSYFWTSCTSTGTTCTTTETTGGVRVYSVNGRNASGFGPAASVSVTWIAPPSAAPVCTVSASPPDPYAGATTTLTANCTQSPTSYQWSGCSAATGNTCRASSASVGPVTYSVTASNAIGTSAAASVSVNWRTPPPPGTDFCGSYTDVKRIDLVWGGFTSTNDPGGGYAADAVLVGVLRVPSTATGTSSPGNISIVEFVNAAATRIMTLSTAACDFRGFTPGVFPASDPSGMTAPMAWGFGINPNVNFALAGMPGNVPKLIPGQTYYVNVRNREYSTGQLSCGGEECNVRITVNPPR